MGAIYPSKEGQTTSVIFTTSGTKVVKSGSGRVGIVSVRLAGSGAGAVYDDASGSPTAANLIAVIPTISQQIQLCWPCVNGITLVVGTGQTIALSYS